MANTQIAQLFETMDYGPAPEAANIALDWLKERGPKQRIYINGHWTEPTGGEYFESINPANGKPITQIAQAGAADVDAAVSAARAAFESWSKTSGHIRARYLYALARQVQKHSRLLAVLESMDNGKPIRETRDIDIPLVARHFYYHAGWAQLMESEFPDYGPVGVVGQIIPWNFPLLMLSWKIAPALAMGNTVVMKPAEFTSITALKFAEICDEIGLPPGVVNIITGDGKVGERIVNHPGVDKIAFTGSTEVGRIIRKATAGSGKRVSLELGGKSPFIVFEDADLDSVVEGVVDAIWFNQGQVCCAGSRLLVQEGIADKLIARLRTRMEHLRIGDPLDKAVDIGAIIAPVQLEKIKGLVDQGVKEGAQMWQPSWACPTEGCFYPPTLFTNVSPAAMIAQVEIFGPVLVTMTFRTPAEAVALANNTPYGLAASVWSDNLNLSLDIARKVKAGTVWINSTNLFDAASGFGGYRESGYGREGGREGLYEYIKPVWEGTSPRADEGSDALISANGEEEQVHNHRDDKKLSPNGHGTKAMPAIDRTPKMFIGGKQARPDSGYSLPMKDAQGHVIAEVGDGNRKDIRNAVEAAHAAESWGFTTGHARAQILYYIAENLSARAAEFAERIKLMTGRNDAQAEVDLSISRLFTYAAWADKYDGQVHATPLRGVVLAIHEPIGVVGIACPVEYPLLGFVSLIGPAVAMGNTVVAIPSEAHPLSATDFYQVIETSDVPAGVINVVTGKRDTLTKVLAEHDDVDSMWYFGTADGSKMVEASSAVNMKRTWVNYGHSRDWLDRVPGEGEEFLIEATQVKNIWTPVPVNDLLNEARLRSALGARPFRFEMQVGSTNDIARDWALNGAPSGSVVLTEEQITGRGRFGRKWSAPPGTALLMSVILRPRVAPEHITRLTMVGAVSVAETLQALTPRHSEVTPSPAEQGSSPLWLSTGSPSPQTERGAGGEVLAVTLKWPNDVLLTNRKVAGILPEAIWQGQSLAAVILGIGLNVRVDFAGTDFEDRSASIEQTLGIKVDRALLLAQLLQRIDYWAMRVVDTTLLEAWRSRLVTLGQHITARGPAGLITGLAADVDDNGGLVLQADDGTIHHVVAGEVTLSESGR